MLPEWPPGTVAVLVTAGAAPHGIPVSTAVRTGPTTLVFVLSMRRESLARLRRDPRCALTILAAGDVAVTAHGRATVVQAPMTVSDRVAALRLDVESVQNHNQPTYEIEDGVRWRWTDADAAAKDAELRAALKEL
jgi:flavin reductase (DIM6/NTAB) family NADH-FMN oxidoreductase RutF